MLIAVGQGRCEVERGRVFGELQGSREIPNLLVSQDHDRQAETNVAQRPTHRKGALNTAEELQ